MQQIFFFLSIQSNSILKNKLSDVIDITEFYNSYLPKEYPQLISHARKMITMFGSTYTCEKLVLKLTL
jgi:hypothetical protein